MYERDDSDGARVIEWDGGISWIAHPDEKAQRASHALETEGGVWLLDPLDAPDIEEAIAPLGEVIGVALLSSFHARDAGLFARKHDVSVHIPEWMDRIESRVEASVEQYTLTPDESFRLLPCRPFPSWQEVFLYHEPTGTLAVGDSLGTIDTFLIEDERLGMSVVRRLQPPQQLAGLAPERILVGHGEPVTENASAALQDVLADSRRSFPTALRENGTESLRAMIGAVIG
jgi:hypothetical protein